ncbi:MAG TPA: PAS domain S-box protein [Thermodesulfobacteriota bacterium]|nr:PAS domain S-box protein [Thermodesulfobacteriota bacterium]
MPSELSVKQKKQKIKHKTAEELRRQYRGCNYNLKVSRAGLLSDEESFEIASSMYESTGEGRYRNLFENIPIGLYRTTPDGRIVMANQALIRMLGYSSFDELASRNLEREGFDINYPRSEFKELLERDGVIRGLESAWLRHDNSILFVRENARMIRGKKGEALYYEGTVEDITEQKRVEEALRESEEKYRTLVEHSYDLIIETSVNGRFLYVSPNHKAVLGYKPRELIGRDIFELIHPDDSKETRAEFQRAILTGSSGHSVFRFKHKRGRWHWLESMGRVFRTSTGEFRGIIASRDITKQKQAEEQIKASLEEKEILLKEIYHRVKNNLQLISSLLNLKLQYITDGRAAEMFKETQNRIRSMALIHAQLYQSNNLAMIDLERYIQSLANNLFSMYGVSSDAIRLEVDVNNVLLDIDRAIPCGLIINELVSNSLKYAFPKNKKGRIRIMLRRDDSVSRLYTLIVEDNGVGFPNDLDFRNTESLGLQIVMDLVEQMEGKIGLDRNGGTLFKITFSS